VGQVTRLSPDLDAEPKADAVKPRRGSKWIPEVIIAVVVAAVFFFSWQQSKNRDAILSSATPTQTSSGTESQPASRTGAFSTQSSLDPIYQQARTLTGQGHFKKAIPLLDKACNTGDAQACSDLGHLYDWGPHFSKEDSVTQNYPRAMKLYTKACDAGNADGCYGLGFLYDQGFGVPQSFARAAEYYTKACDGNNSAACNNLGFAFRNGAGVTEDKEKARQLLQKACSLGNQSSCDSLNHL